MADDFVDDLGTPTEQDLNDCYGSKYLSAADLGDRKVRTRLAKIRKEMMRQQGGTERPRFVIFFTTLDKPLVLNTTNKITLVDALGGAPADWIDAEIGIYAEPTQFGGKATKGLRLRVLSPPKKVAMPKLATAPKKADAASTEPPPDDPEDPGAFPERDADFGEAAE
jgi:hypothetical protein